MIIKKAIKLIVHGHDLSDELMSQAMQSIMQGEATPAQIAAFITGLRMKGETINEIATAVNVMRAYATLCPIDNLPAIDIVGTGGDTRHTFNISTATSFVVAAAGGVVAKHGNRSVSSCSGSADVLEAAGVNIHLTPSEAAECIRQIGIGFIFAPLYHQAVRHSLAVRKEIGIYTLFNLLGPLTNPANAKTHLIGVFNKNWVLPIAEVLQLLGSQHALIVHSEDGMDEISIGADTFVAELTNRKITTYMLNPLQFNLPQNPISSLQVQNSQESLKLIHQVFNNQNGPAKDCVVLNAGAALYAGNICPTIEAGIKTASEVIAAGLAKKKLQELIELSQEFYNARK